MELYEGYTVNGIKVIGTLTELIKNEEVEDSTIDIVEEENKIVDLSEVKEEMLVKMESFISSIEYSTEEELESIDLYDVFYTQVGEDATEEEIEILIQCIEEKGYNVKRLNSPTRYIRIEEIKSMKNNNQIIETMNKVGFKLNVDSEINFDFYINTVGEDFGIHEDVKLYDNKLQYSSYTYKKSNLEKLHENTLEFGFNSTEELLDLIENRFTGDAKEVTKMDLQLLASQKEEDNFKSIKNG